MTNNTIEDKMKFEPINGELFRKYQLKDGKSIKIMCPKSYVEDYVYHYIFYGKKNIELLIIPRNNISSIKVNFDEKYLSNKQKQ